MQNASNTEKTKTNATPKWVNREIARLNRLAAMGGNSSAIEFQRQAYALRVKYVLPFLNR